MLFAPVMFLLLAVMFPRRVNPKMFVGHRVVIVASVVDELANVASPVELRAPLNHASPVDVKRDVVALVKLANPSNHDLPETVSKVVEAFVKVVSPVALRVPPIVAFPEVWRVPAVVLRTPTPSPPVR